MPYRLIPALALLLLLGCSGGTVRTSDDDHYREMLAKQLAMNEATFAQLKSRGLTPETEVSLEFFYIAASEDDARALADLLQAETDYEVAAHLLEDPTPTWVVSGKTTPTTITLQVLDEWVEWMVNAGHQNNCEFDGWGTEI
jgi:hypothetical protein